MFVRRVCACVCVSVAKVYFCVLWLQIFLSNFAFVFLLCVCVCFTVFSVQNKPGPASLQMFMFFKLLKLSKLFFTFRTHEHLFVWLLQSDNRRCFCQLFCYSSKMKAGIFFWSLNATFFTSFVKWFRDSDEQRNFLWMLTASHPVVQSCWAHGVLIINQYSTVTQ